jgi:hypothetical protein
MDTGLSSKGTFFRVEIPGAQPLLIFSSPLGLAGAFSSHCWDRLVRLLKLLFLAEGPKMDTDELLLEKRYSSDYKTGELTNSTGFFAVF